MVSIFFFIISFKLNRERSDIWNYTSHVYRYSFLVNVMFILRIEVFCRSDVSFQLRPCSCNQPHSFLHPLGTPPAAHVLSRGRRSMRAFPRFTCDGIKDSASGASSSVRSRYFKVDKRLTEEEGIQRSSDRSNKYERQIYTVNKLDSSSV